jgi:MYXO-CTERM domain-containing protein
MRCCGAAGLLAAGGCLAEDADGPDAFRSLPEAGEQPLLEVNAPLGGAHCMISVDGIGSLEMETDYLPHVVQCENGGADLEALKAQAIAARSVAYYAIETAGSICDSQGCQVYSCAATPSAAVYQAVEETSGMYLMFNSTLTYGFYVAGDNGVSPPACVGNAAVGTEHWVTYNEGAVGDAVEQTELGFIHAPGDNGYGQNRGCMSQWGARCLEANNGYDYVDILRFYFGDDIGIEQAQGACVTPAGDGGNVGDSSGDGAMGGTTGAAPGTGGAADTGAGADGGDTLDSGAPGGGDSNSASASAGPGGGDGTAAADDGFDTEEALPDTFGGVAGDGGGCACRAADTTTPAAGWWLGLFGLFGLRRRRD